MLQLYTRLTIAVATVWRHRLRLVTAGLAVLTTFVVVAKSLPMSLREQVTAADIICLCRTEHQVSSDNVDSLLGQEVVVTSSVLETLKASAPPVIQVRTYPQSSVSARLDQSSVNFLFLRRHGALYDLVDGENSVVGVNELGVVTTGFIIGQPETQPSAVFASLVRQLTSHATRAAPKH